jgi:hypothetical protein
VFTWIWGLQRLKAIKDLLLFTMDQPSLSERLATIERRAFLSQRLEAIEQHIAEGNAQMQGSGGLLRT